MQKNWYNNFAITRVKGKQPFFKPIYNAKLVENKALKTYIKINLINAFI